MIDGKTRNDVWKERYDRMLWPMSDTLKSGRVLVRDAAGLLTAFLLLFILAQDARAEILAKVRLSKQSISIIVDGELRYAWPISTGREGYDTPIGKYQPEKLHKTYFSRQYNSAPMPHSIFFHRGYAIHGTTKLARLGRRASRGCIRLHPDDAKTFFNLVQRHGLRYTKIDIAN
jgi:lipoprotein-anchoring transpeptidase ErfK/SrfK